MRKAMQIRRNLFGFHKQGMLVCHAVYPPKRINPVKQADTLHHALTLVYRLGGNECDRKIPSTVDAWHSTHPVRLLLQWESSSEYQNRTFHPTQTVTRAELIVMLQAIDRYLVKFRGNWDGRRPYTQPVPLNFSDIQNHWAQDTMTEMSGNYHTGQVATPLNEMGTQFAPNTAAQRNYAAAIVRELRCLNVPAISS